MKNGLRRIQVGNFQLFTTPVIIHCGIVTEIKIRAIFKL